MRLFRHRQEQDRDLSPESRSLLTILIREIQDTINPRANLEVMEALDKLLTPWITANNLHPEQVTITYEGEHRLYTYREEAGQNLTSKILLPPEELRHKCPHCGHIHYGKPLSALNTVP